MYSPLDYFASDRGGGGEAGSGFGNFFFTRGRNVARVIMVGCAKDEVGGEGKVVYPVSVSGQGTNESAISCIPYLDSFVLGRGV